LSAFAVFVSLIESAISLLSSCGRILPAKHHTVPWVPGVCRIPDRVVCGKSAAGAAGGNGLRRAGPLSDYFLPRHPVVRVDVWRGKRIGGSQRCHQDQHFHSSSTSGFDSICAVTLGIAAAQ
jgi:hypothetical protein